MGEIINAAGTRDLEQYVDSMLAALSPVFETEDADTLLRKLYTVLSKEFVKADENLQKVKNDNYVKVKIMDEVRTRGSSKKDKLDEENAYKIDSIRFVPTDFIQSESLFLDEGQDTIQLYFIPSDIENITIFKTGNIAKTPVANVLSFDSESNTITTDPFTELGLYTIEYLDTGDTIQTKENVRVPEDLFEIGYGDGLYGSLGYGE